MASIPPYLKEYSQLPRPITFVERQTLEARDLRDAQAYRLKLRHLHNQALHAPGILSGLGLNVGMDPRGFWLEQGFAIDGFGRELIVPRPVFTPWESSAANGALLNLFERIGSSSYFPPDSDLFQYQHIDVWLRYRLVPGGRHRGTKPPQPPHRWLEQAFLCLTAVAIEPANPDLQQVGGPVPTDPHRPPGLPPELHDGSAGVDPLQALNASAEQDWPVYLGRLTRQFSPLAGGEVQNSYSLDPAQPPLSAPLVGAAIHSASRFTIPEDPKDPNPTPRNPVPTAQMLLGDERFENRLHFAVRVADENGKLAERLRLDRPGGGTISGDLTLARFPNMSVREQAYDLRLESLPPDDRDEELPDPERPGCILPAADVKDASALRFNARSAPPKQAYPWRMYRTEVVEQGKTIQELRIEIADSGDPKTPERNQFEIGSWHDQKGVVQFHPCLIVRENCEVEFTADEVTLIGSYRTDPALKPPIQTAPGEPVPEVPPGAVPPTGEAFLEELARQWAAGIGSGAGVATGLDIQTPAVLQRTPGQPTFSYPITLTNNSGLPFSFISVVESLQIGNDLIPTRLVGGIFQLPPGQTEQIQVDHPAINLPANPMPIRISLTVIAFDPAFKPLYATHSKNQNI